MHVHELMRKNPITCFSNAPAELAAALMKEHDIGFLPIVEQRNGMELLRGVITDRDLCTKVLAVRPDHKTYTVADCMATDLITCKANDQLETALELMQSNQLRRIPVVEGQRIVGVISLNDIGRARVVKAEQLANALQKICTPKHVPAKLVA